MRRQAIEMMRTMCQEDNEQMHQYIVRHEVGHAWAQRLSPDDQLSLSEIIEFTMTLQPFIQDKLLKRIDGEDMEEIDAMELHPRDNAKKIFHGNDRGNRNFGLIGRGSFDRGG